MRLNVTATSGWAAAEPDGPRSMGETTSDRRPAVHSSQANQNFLATAIERASLSFGQGKDERGQSGCGLRHPQATDDIRGHHALTAAA